MTSKTCKFFQGQSLIGVLVALAVFSILSQAIFTVARTSFNFVSYNRARITARHLAQEKLETIRNMPYEEVGTQGGIPPGPIAQEETITRNKLTYKVKTTIIFIDDPFDELAPSDILPTDYKRVRVEVSWQGLTSSGRNPVVFLSDISPKGVETNQGGGTLSIIVFDSNGMPVSQANVSINAATTPPVNLNLTTSSNGRIILPGAPPCNSCYQITVSKSGYSSERTYSTSEVANPNKPHQTVIAGQLTEISFSIDRVSTLNVTLTRGRDENFQPLANTDFRLTGQKTIGTDTQGNPVYKFDQVFATDNEGHIQIPNLEWDIYTAKPRDSNLFDLSGSNPYQPFSLAPNSNLNLKIAFSPNSSNSLLITFIDSSSTQVASVSARLTAVGFNQEKVAGDQESPDWGQTFFPNLNQQEYNLFATASGFLDHSSPINVQGDTNAQIILNRQ